MSKPLITSSLADALQSQPVLGLEHLPSCGLPYLLTAQTLRQPIAVICPDERRAHMMAHNLRCLTQAPVELLLADEATAFSPISADVRLTWGRLALRCRLLTASAPGFVVLNAAAVQGRWMDTPTFAAHIKTVRVGETIVRDALLQHLVLCGYQAVNMVEDEATFAVRGSVIDVFVPNTPYPVRMDLFGDELTDLTSFDPQNQRPQQRIEQLTIFPIRDVVLGDTQVDRAQAWLRTWQDTSQIPTHRLRTLQQQLGLRNYFFGIEALMPIFYAETEAIFTSLSEHVALWVWDGVEAIDATWKKRAAQAHKEREHNLAQLHPQVALAQHMTALETLQHMRDTSVPRILHMQLVPDDMALTIMPTGLTDIQALADATHARRKDPALGDILDPLLSWMAQQQRQDYAVFLVCGSLAHANRLRMLLLARHIDLPISEDLPQTLAAAHSRPQATCRIVIGGLSAGLVDPIGKVALVTDVELFSATRQTQRPNRKRPDADALSTLQDLQPQDTVIHREHGIGRYLGLKKLFLHGVEGDFVHLEYADQDKLYIPIFRLNLLQRHHAPDPKHVRLDKLGGQSWQKTQARVRDAVVGVAHQILAVQAQRRLLKGHALSVDKDAFATFEASFPFEETPDQQRAIDAVLADLQKPHPMDRLVCGDVGFGKTEVAMRAAYFTVLSGFQVAVLVPTTVLAEQHDASFRERMAHLGVEVEVLSRFRTPKQSRAILKRLQKGQIDILIGTHRLLSADVHFAKLGLLIVDEEQRFGVKNKEHIKKWRAQVHVLTLSATPIPRTLHMATAGLRDLSLIQTPPAARSGIRTDIVRFNPQTVTEAIRHEMHRGGQVFIVHNRVQTIQRVAEEIGQWMPEARIGIAHGQMSADMLERVMLQFVRHALDVLVCTAIIESGLDIPSANTMIVLRADTFGLSQLYQLRGRIGRGQQRGHAYLMLPTEEDVLPNREALERLALLKRFSALGSGFQIASHDLNLRGAGDLLGSDQSGHIAAVGFELYLQLLEEAVDKAKGGHHAPSIEPEIKVDFAAILPETYVPEPMQRLAFYQRMAQAQSHEVIYDVAEQIKHVYGPWPQEVQAWIEIMLLRRDLKALGVHQFSMTSDPNSIRVGLHFIPQAPIDSAQLLQQCRQDPARYRLLPSGGLALTLPLEGRKLPAPPQLVQQVRQFLQTLPQTPNRAGKQQG